MIWTPLAACNAAITERKVVINFPTVDSARAFRAKCYRVIDREDLAERGDLRFKLDKTQLTIINHDATRKEIECLNQ